MLGTTANMAQPPVPPPAKSSPVRTRGVSLPAVPSWLLSVIVHMALLIVLGLTMRVAPRGLGTEPDREVGIVIKRLDPQGEAIFESPADAPDAPTPAQSAAAASVSEMVGEKPPVDIAGALPKGRELAGIGTAPGQSPDVTGFTQGPKATTALTGGRVRTKVYGIEGEGSKFVYVFDRSGSMGGSGNTALRAAKAELLASLENLGPTNQFQIIFYNDKQTIFSLAGAPGRLVFGTDQNKQVARNFVQGIIADGGTHHEPALEAALAMSPDVIFFLTDADQPALSPAQLLRIQRKNRGAAIHTIEFGLDPVAPTDNFLSRLARENNGKYVYIDISRGK